MITKDKITEIFYIIDEFSSIFDAEIEKRHLLSTTGKNRRMRKASLSDSEIMTILLLFHFGIFRNFKHYYLHYIKEHLSKEFPNAVSYNRFIELESRVFFKLVFFLNMRAFGKCTGFSFVDSTMIPVCHNMRRYANKVTGVRANMKNKLISMWDKMLLRERYIIETINGLLKDSAQIVHSRHRSINNFIMNLISALGAYCFFENKPKALLEYTFENTKRLYLF